MRFMHKSGFEICQLFYVVFDMSFLGSFSACSLPLGPWHSLLCQVHKSLNGTQRTKGRGRIQSLCMRFLGGGGFVVGKIWLVVGGASGTRECSSSSSSLSAAAASSAASSVPKTGHQSFILKNPYSFQIPWAGLIIWAHGVPFITISGTQRKQMWEGTSFGRHCHCITGLMDSHAS